jgi:putative ABC transport system permease protein
MSRLLFLKLARDLRATAGRIVLMVVALTVSLVAFGTILFTRSIVGDQIGVSYMGTDPASATIVLDRGVDPGQLAGLRSAARAQPGVVDATLRSQLTFQMLTPGGDLLDDPLQLFVAAPDDPMRIGRFPVERGSWPPPADGVLLERNALEFLHLSVGDRVIVKAPDGRPVSLRVTGVVHDPSLAPAYEERKGYGYVSTAALPLLGEQPTLDEVKIVVADRPGQTAPSRDRNTVVRTALGVAASLERTPGVHVQQVQVPQPYRHPHQGQMNALLLAVLVFGAMSLLVSAVLVATMVNGLLTRQIPQIGVLKAIGARQGRVLQLYLAMTLLIALAATALALVPAILLGRAYARLLLDRMLNMDAASLATPWWTYAAVLAAGVLLPPLVALAPLLRASRTTVREAIDDSGGDRRGLTADRLDVWLGRIRGLDRALLIGLRNMARHRARLLLSVALLGTAGALFVSGLSTVAAAQAVPGTMAAEQRWDVDVRLDQAADATALTRLAAGVPHVTHAEAWTVAPSGVQQPGQVAVTETWPDQGHGSVSVAALPPRTSVLTPPPLVEGRWLRPDDTDAVVLNQLARQSTLPGVHAGDTVQLSLAGRSTTWHVVGVVRELFAGTCPCVTAAGFEQATGTSNEANGLRILTDRHDPATRAAAAHAVERELAGASIRVRSSRPADWLGAVADGHMYAVAGVVLAIAGVMALVGLIGLGSTMSASVLERTRELGTMHAIGARASTVRRIVVSEGVFMALASCVVAVLLALALTAALAEGVGDLMVSAPLPFRFSAPAVLVWVVAVVAGAVLATLAPASRAARLTVREALARL